MEFKGTKGQWLLSETPTANCKSIKTESGEYIGMLSLNVVRPALMAEQKVINEANAKLISCAPEMLEVLQDMLDASYLPKHVNDQIKATISKATTI